MAQKINRDNLLKQLEDMTPGLSQKEITEQSSCFVFRNGFLITFNDQVSCRMKLGQDDLQIEGSVSAQKFVAILQKLPEEYLTAEVKDNVLVFKGKNRSVRLIMEAEDLLDLAGIEKPTGWQPLPDGFDEAVSIVSQCAGTDESMFANTCVHLTKNYIEATDRFQIARYKLKLKLERSILIKGDSLRSVMQRAPSKYCQTGNWLHFKNANGLVVSCRVYADDFPEVGVFLNVSGKPAALPKGLLQAIEKADVFSSENSVDNQVLIELRSGKLRIKGEGASGSFTETKNMQYTGPEMKFFIKPDLLTKFVQDHNECEVTDDALKVDGGVFVYVTSLERA